MKTDGNSDGAGDGLPLYSIHGPGKTSAKGSAKGSLARRKTRAMFKSVIVTLRLPARESEVNRWLTEKYDFGHIARGLVPLLPWMHSPHAVKR